MVNPQKENGYTPIANEVMEAVAKLKINATQFRILIVVWRYTYGFSRKQHYLSESYLANATGIHKKRIGQELLDLIKRNIITEITPPTFSAARVVAFNKHYCQWQTEKDSQRKEGQSTETLTGNETIDETVNENVDRGGSENVDQDKQVFKTKLKQKDIDAFFDSVWKLYPLKKGKSSVKHKTREVLYNIGYDTIKTCVERYELWVEAERNSRFPGLQYQHGSRFFNGGYIDYLDENYTPQNNDDGWEIV